MREAPDRDSGVGRISSAKASFTGLRDFLTESPASASILHPDRGVGARRGEKVLPEAGVPLALHTGS